MAEQTGEFVPKPPDSSQKDTKMSRRNFLKAAGAAVASPVAEKVESDLKNVSKVMDAVGLRGKHVQQHVPTYMPESFAGNETEPAGQGALVIDIAFGNPSEGVTQEKVSHKEEYFKKVLGESYKSEQDFIAKYGNDYKSRLKDIAKDREFRKAALLYGLVSDELPFGSHGPEVASTMMHVLKDLNAPSSIEMLPLQEMLSPEDISFEEDPFGVSVNFVIRGKKVAEAVKGHNQPVYNTSFEFGKVGYRVNFREKQLIGDAPFLVGVDFDTGEDTGLYYPKDLVSLGNVGGKPRYINKNTGEVMQGLTKEEKDEWLDKNYTKIVDLDPPGAAIAAAHTPEPAEESIEETYQFCEANPRALVIGANGNERGEDTRAAQQKLSTTRVNGIPNNLLFVGEWHEKKGRPANDVFGAHIYVDNEVLGLKPGSTFSTSVISAFALSLFKQGLDMQAVKAKILDACNERIVYDNDGNEVTVRLLNTEKMKEAQISLPKAA